MTESAKYEYPGIVRSETSVGQKCRLNATSLTFGSQHLNNKNHLDKRLYVSNEGVWAKSAWHRELANRLLSDEKRGTLKTMKH